MSKKKRAIEKAKKLEARQQNAKNQWKNSADYLRLGPKDETRVRKKKKGSHKNWGGIPSAAIDENIFDSDILSGEFDAFAGDVSEDLYGFSPLVERDPSQHHQPYEDHFADGEDIIITESYKGAGRAPMYFFDEYIYPSEMPSAQHLPCFLVAEKKNHYEWVISRYVGETSPGPEGMNNPTFLGKPEVIHTTDWRNVNSIAQALSEWCRSQPEGYVSQSENHIFSHASKITSETALDMWRESSTYIIREQDPRFNDSFGRGKERRDFR